MFLVCLVSRDPPTPNVASNYRVVPLDLNLSMDVSANASQFCEIHRPEGDVVQHNSRRFQNEIMGSGKTFPNVDAFHDVVYLMSIAGRFQYYYNINCFKHMTIVCTLNESPWKITCHVIGASYVVQVHTFVNEHKHTVDDIVSVTPQTRGSVDYPSTHGIQVVVGLPNTTSENRVESPLYGELYPITLPA